MSGKPGVEQIVAAARKAETMTREEIAKSLGAGSLDELEKRLREAVKRSANHDPSDFSEPWCDAAKALIEKGNRGVQIEKRSEDLGFQTDMVATYQSMGFILVGEGPRYYHLVRDGEYSRKVDEDQVRRANAWRTGAQDGPLVETTIAKIDTDSPVTAEDLMTQ